jgi:hypothetical protein
MEKEQSQFLIIFVLASQYPSHSFLLDNAAHFPKWFLSWVRGGCIVCIRGRGGFQCGEDVYPSSHAQRTIEILKLPFFLASLVFWLFLASMVFRIILSLVHVCIHFGTPVLNLVDWNDRMFL